MSERAKTGLHAGLFYAGWYPKRWLPLSRGIPSDLDSQLSRDLRTTASLSRKLARTLFHAMALNGPKLERRQLLLGRLVDAGSELLAMSVSAARAHALGDEASLQTARFICHRGEQRVRALFADSSSKRDAEAYRLAKRLIS
jgi:hypothetical protein